MVGLLLGNVIRNIRLHFKTVYIPGRCLHNLDIEKRGGEFCIILRNLSRKSHFQEENKSKGNLLYLTARIIHLSNVATDFFALQDYLFCLFCVDFLVNFIIGIYSVPE